MSGHDELEADLGASVSDVTAELEGVAQRSSHGAIEYRRGDLLFAVVDGDAVEIRLRPDIAEAILRTPETGPSKRGSQWIRFVPTSIDPSVEDRLAAWVTAAWRAATN